MRISILAAAFLILGVIVGSITGRQEFSHEVLPLDGNQAAGTSPAGTQSTGPRLTIVTPERFDFGVMDEHATMHHVFEIRNDGDEPLQVTKEGTSCKCTAAGLDKDRLPPNETALITLEWTPKGPSDLFEQYAEYKTNDIARPKFKLVISGVVRSMLRAEPREAVFNRVSSQEPAQAKVKIYGMGAGEMQIVNYKFTHQKSAPYFSLQFKPLDPASFPPNFEYKSGVEMQVDLKPGLPLGQLQQTIQISTNFNPDATYDIPVYGSIVSDISLAGPHASSETMTVDLGSFSGRQGTKATVFLVLKGAHRDSTALKIASVTPAAELSASIGEPVRDNPKIVTYPLVFEVPPGTSPVSRMSSGSRMEVRVETTHPQVKEVVVHIKYAVVD
jgi:hypothetical protein